MSLFSTGFSTLIGLPLGVAIGKSSFRGKGAVIRITDTLMGLPPVVAGLIVFMLFRSIGPFGQLRMLFTVRVMVVAQVLLITPVVTGLAASAAEDKAKNLSETAAGIGIPRFRQTLLLMVMTTAIMLETNKGNFDVAIALGIILLLLSLAVNIIAHIVQRNLD